MIFLLAMTTIVLAVLNVFGRAPPETVLTFALATAAAIVYVRVVSAWLAAAPGYDELHLVRADDGWTLPMYRYRPAGEAKGAVLMVHGIYSTMGVFDVAPDMSLARHLRDRGFDVYCLELRDMGVNGRRSRWWKLHEDAATFDHYVLADVPAAVRDVQRTSGFARIHYVGHSMGGMIFYPYGGSEAGQRSIARAVTMGSMAGLPDHRWLRFLPIPWGLLSRLPHYGVKEASAFLLAPLVGIGFFVELYFLNPWNVAARHRRRYFFNGVANSPLALLGHFAAMYRSRTLMSKDGKHDFDALMRQNQTPTLVIAATHDHIASLPLVKKGYDALPGDKRWLELSKKNGVAANFGHTDMAFGRAAEAIVWPEIVRWLEK